MDRSPKIEWLQTFVDVVDLGSYAEAGKKGEINDSGAIKRVKNLKESLDGLELFHANSTTLTENGRRILEVARRMLTTQQELVDLAGDLRDGVEGIIRIACYPAHIQHFLAEVAGKFKQAHPRTRLVIAPIDHAGTAGQGNLDQLHARKVDLAVGAKSQEFDGHMVYEARLVVVVPDDHALRHEAKLSVGKLRGEHLLLAPPHYFSRGEIDRACREAGFVPMVEVESSSWAALQALGRHGVGFAIVPDDTLPPDSGAPFPTLLTEAGEPIKKQTWFQWRRGEQASTAVENFKDAVRAFCDARRAVR